MAVWTEQATPNDPRREVEAILKKAGLSRPGAIAEIAGTLPLREDFEQDRDYFQRAEVIRLSVIGINGQIKNHAAAKQYMFPSVGFADLAEHIEALSNKMMPVDAKNRISAIRRALEQYNFAEVATRAVELHNDEVADRVCPTR